MVFLALLFPIGCIASVMYLIFLQYLLAFCRCLLLNLLIFGNNTYFSFLSFVLYADFSIAPFSTIDFSPKMGYTMSCDSPEWGYMPPCFVVKVVYYIVDNVFIFTPPFSKYISRYFIPGSSPGGGSILLMLTV